MSSREEILGTVAMNKPSMEELPIMDFAEAIRYEDIVRQFIDSLKSVGGKIIYLNSRHQLLDNIEANKVAGNLIINRLVGTDIKEHKFFGSDRLETLHTCYLQSYLAVAENGAVWIDERQAGNRLIPFICQHLVIILNPDNIVSNMHEAYRRINFDTSGFGVFIAGPSKTADIEQNLVVGAHGPRSLTVYLIEDNLFSIN